MSIDERVDRVHVVAVCDDLSAREKEIRQTIHTPRRRSPALRVVAEPIPPHSDTTKYVPQLAGLSDTWQGGELSAYMVEAGPDSELPVQSSTDGHEQRTAASWRGYQRFERVEAGNIGQRLPWPQDVVI
jgi:hypothetical protein